MVYLSVVVPAYNEILVLEKNIKKLYSEVKRNYSDFELIITDNGSTDETYELAKKLAEKYRKIKSFHIDEKGRGGALRKAFKMAKGKIVMYLDVDLAPDIKAIPQLVNKIEDGCDFVTGSRFSYGSKVYGRTITRRLGSRGYNFLCKSLFRIGINDLQCGFKVFKKSSLMKVIDNVKNTEWFWDTETFVLGHKMGMEIAEVPIAWNAGVKSKVKFHRDVVVMGYNIFRLYFRLIFRGIKSGKV